LPGLSLPREVEGLSQAPAALVEEQEGLARDLLPVRETAKVAVLGDELLGRRCGRHEHDQQPRQHETPHAYHVARAPELGNGHRTNGRKPPPNRSRRPQLVRSCSTSATCSRADTCG